MITINAPAIQSTISGVSFAGLTITGPDGQPATLAVVDQSGRVLESGPSVAAAAWNVAIRSHEQFLIGMGHLRIMSGPTTIDGKVVA
jgi:hypothetical protein